MYYPSSMCRPNMANLGCLAVEKTIQMRSSTSDPIDMRPLSSMCWQHMVNLGWMVIQKLI